MEREVIADIARRVKKTGRYTETAELMAKAMREQGYNTAKIQREVLKTLRADKSYKSTVAQNTKAYKQFIKNIIKDTVYKAAIAGDKLVGSAGDMAWNDDLQVWKAHNIDLKKPNNLNQLYQAFKLQTKQQLRNITQSTGFVGTLLGTTGVLNMYQRSMDLALLKLSTGTFSYDQVVKDLVHQLAQSGLRSIDYASGRSYHIDTAARMVVRTASSQLAGKITEMNIEKTGVELVYVDAHAGARPSHAIWQGKVYSYKGSSKKYPNFVKATNYGDVTGLKGANCTHNFYPYWEGSPIPEFEEPEPVKVNGKEYTRYEATQQQRKMERGIRATKREIEGLKAAGYDTNDLNKKLNSQLREYNQFSKAVDLRPKKNRLNIVTGDANIKQTENQYSALSYIDKKELIHRNEKNIENLLSEHKQAEIDMIMAFDIKEVEKAQKEALTIQSKIDSLKSENEKIQKALGLPTNAKERFYAQTTDISKLPAYIQKDELGAIGSWTRTGYTSINDYKRTGNKGIRKEYIEDANTLEKMIDRNVVSESFTVKRGTDFNAMNHLFGNDNWQKEGYNVSDKVIRDDGFMATTPELRGGFGGNIQMYIDIPEGAKGVYIGDKSAAPDEKEFLLQCGTSFIVDKIEISYNKWDEPLYDIYMKVIVDK